MDEEIEKRLLADTKVEELTGENQVIANLIGLENLLKLSHYANGSHIYIPIPETILRKARNREIKNQYNGCNKKEIAEMWDITENQVEKILRGYDPKQMDIFDVWDDEGNLKE